jgi:hypothetical protein
MTRITSRNLRVATAVALIVAAFHTGSNVRRVHGMESDPIPWREDYAAALQEARTVKRLLWVHFTGPWCPSCQRMERDSFSAPAIVEHARDNFIPLKVRADIDQQLALNFDVSGLPATIVVAPNLEVLAFHQGYLGPTELDALLATVNERRAGARAAHASNSSQTLRRDQNRRRVGRTGVERPLALSGYCPVSLHRDRKLMLGRSDLATVHEGRIYRFADRDKRDQFRTDPVRFVPRNDEACPVSRLDRGSKVPGNPRWGVIFQDRLFLCASAEDRQRFLESPGRYAAVDTGSLEKNDAGGDYPLDELGSSTH